VLVLGDAMATKYFKQGWTANISKAAILQLGTNPGGASMFIPIGDFNGDGHTDIIATFSTGEFGQVLTDPMPGRMILLLGDGKGSFTDGTDTLPGQGDFDYLIRKYAVADFNGDGKDDLAMSLNWESGRGGDASVIAAPQFALMSHNGGLVGRDLDFTTWGHAFASGDVNFDGRQDFVIAGFTADPESHYGAALYLQNADGSLTQKGLENLGGSAIAFGDFDRDNITEFLDIYATYGGGGDLTDVGFRVFELDNEGNFVGTPVDYSEGAFQFLPDESGFKYVVRTDASGNYYTDGILQEIKPVDIDGDGRLEIAGVRYTTPATVNNGIVTLTGEFETHLEFFALGAGGLEKLDIKMDGGSDLAPRFQDYQFMDWNGDGHIDIVIPRWGFEGENPVPRVFLNDGAAHFSAIKQSLMPSLPSYLMSMSSAVLDANEDGVMDVYMHVAGGEASSNWGTKSDFILLGTTKFYTGPKYTDPALRGAAGFNEQYYLNTYADAKAAVKAHTYASGLDHYLAVGKKHGYFGFAVDTHIFGSDNADTIKAREGEERLDGGLGKDTLTGKGSADTFVFSTKLGPTNVDTIKDFKPGQGDVIALDRDIFKKVGPTLDEAEFYAAAGAVKAHDRSDRIVYDTTTGKLSYDADGTKKGGVDAIHFATLSNRPTLDVADFDIIA
jgi:hypothetical protein